jgi:hypothetical protein
MTGIGKYKEIKTKEKKTKNPIFVWLKEPYKN